MRQFELVYEGHNKRSARCDITVFEPRELPRELWPGCQIVILGEPHPYEGLSVTNAAERIAYKLLIEHGIGLFGGCVYVEHYTQEGLSERASGKFCKPSFDVVRVKWGGASIDTLKPAMDRDAGYWWHPIPYAFYPPLLEALGEPCPEWIQAKIAKS